MSPTVEKFLKIKKGFKLNDLIDNEELNEILEILENLEDQHQAAKLLKEFNDASKDHGRLILDMDEKLDHSEWKSQCDQAKTRVDDVLNQIRSLK